MAWQLYIRLLCGCGQGFSLATAQLLCTASNNFLTVTRQVSHVPCGWPTTVGPDWAVRAVECAMSFFSTFWLRQHIDMMQAWPIEKSAISVIDSLTVWQSMRCHHGVEVNATKLPYGISHCLQKRPPADISEMMCSTAKTTRKIYPRKG